MMGIHAERKHMTALHYISILHPLTGTASGSEYWWIINRFSVFPIWPAYFSPAGILYPSLPSYFPPFLSLSLEPFLTESVLSFWWSVNLSSLPSNCEAPSTTAILHNLFHRMSAIHIQFSVSEIKYFCHAITLPFYCNHNHAITLKTV